MADKKEYFGEYFMFHVTVDGCGLSNEARHEFLLKKTKVTLYSGASNKEKSPTRFKIFGIYRDLQIYKIYVYEDFYRFMKIFRDL